MNKFNLETLMSSSSQEMYKRGKSLIPGGTQLLSKRPEMFAPDIWPAYYSKAKGCRVWDLDNREFVDMSIMGIGANILGYADEDVDNAVKSAVDNGISSSLNCPEEVELAELLVEIHPWAEMVRYARSGGEAMAMAVRLARAGTKRELVLFSGYHGWMDWYLAANLGAVDGLDGQLMPGLEPRGVPRGLQGSVMPFHFNDIDSLRTTIQSRENEVAAIVVEPARGEEAPREYLVKLREFASEIGAVLIFDEITSGFRMCTGGIHLRYGIHPDIAVFAKSIANGYAMAAVIGIETVMNAAQNTFISSTNWSEKIGPVAAIATIKKYIKENVAEHINNIGNDVKQIWRESAYKHGLPIKISGLPALASFSFVDENNQSMMTFFTIEMLKNGFLGFRQFKSSYAHDNLELTKYSEVVGEIFQNIAEDKWAEMLKSPIAHSGFARLTSE